MEKSAIVKVIVSLGGLALAFALTAVVFQYVVPDAAGLPKDSIVSTIITVVGAMALAIVVISIILSILYIYDSRLKKPYEDRLKGVKREMENSSSFWRIALLTIVTLAWMAVLYFFWRDIPIMVEMHSGTLQPLFTENFAVFVPIFMALGAGMIIANLLYLLPLGKWIPSLCEVAMSIVSLVLFYWILQVFPFNPDLPEMGKLGLALLLVLAIVGSLIDIVGKLWKTLKIIIYGKD
ncbi:hypothetical protein [Methanocella arvoryzae]|uniref:Uncharacterized protein n=1 Tax=Methanocella arvoryzae (strain DSM 22066 / NBRC 105507 / MRE50) TaxID=351160 RepID=Q0W7Q9_METAR|nr:hypothetical protein [Methanocella arvoryzae]CAJ35584.1 hypothetical protein RCIX78 [Methanocella arvoryzae MRE50]